MKASRISEPILHGARTVAMVTALVGPAWIAATPVTGQSDPALRAATPATAPAYSAEIRRTAYGVPHIRATDHAGLGFGAGYAFAEDNICELAEMLVTAYGERSLHFGGDEANVRSDLYFRRMVLSGELEAMLEAPDGPSAEGRALFRGYAAGVSRYLRETGVENIPDPRCRDSAWVREINDIDLFRISQIRSAPLMAGVVAAAPPSPGRTAAAPDSPPPDATSIGSNAYGFGSEVTSTGRGLLLANPHYPWDGVNRFYRMHLTIPGVLDVVGAGLLASPTVGIGHTEHIAWTHTVSTARRYGLFELTLAPDSPTTYLYDGERREMDRQAVTILVPRPDGSLEEVSHTFYLTHFGPVVRTEAYDWTGERAFAVATPNTGLRAVDQYLDIWAARDVRELNAALLRWQATGFNTTAADHRGETFFGDVGSVPHVTDEHAAVCLASPLAERIWESQRIPVLDGSRSDCEWGTDPQAVVPGIFGPMQLPQLFRSDYVSQFNDSYWLTNPAEPIEGLPLILGDEATARSLRTRLGILKAEEAADSGEGGSPFDSDALWATMFDNRNLGAELVRDDLVGLCRSTGTAMVEGIAVELSDACRVLADWDLRVELESRGAHLFREFARLGGLRFRVPFDPADPVLTPHTLDVDDPRVVQALARAVRLLDDAGIRLDAPLGELQTEPRGPDRIPIHGGAGGEGVFNVITAPFAGADGYPKIVHGASFVMVVEFTDEGPRSRGILTYSQSTSPESPHQGDQTWLYSRKGWDDLRFNEEAIMAYPQLRSYAVQEGARDCAAEGWRSFERPSFGSESHCVRHFEAVGAGTRTGN